MRNQPDPERRIERVVVIGAGAVGGSIGGLLFEAGLPIVLIARGAHGDVLRREGLTLRLPGRALEVKPPCSDSVSRVEWRAGDLALLATKLQDAEQVLDETLAAAGRDIPVACAVNGLHGEQWAAARFNTVISTLVWMPATHLRPGEVRLHGAGCLGVLDTGSFCGSGSAQLAERLCALLRGVGFDAVAREDIGRWKYAKWIINLGGAAQAMVEDDWQSVADEAQAEGEIVLEAAGVDRITTEELIARAEVVRSDPVDGKPREGGSTWQSHARGRPLESPWLEGAMAKLAEELGVPAPVNAFLARASISPRALTAAEVLGH